MQVVKEKQFKVKQKFDYFFTHVGKYIILEMWSGTGGKTL